MTDQEIEIAAKKAGGRWDGSRWVFEDADLHPFARALLAAERERWEAVVFDGWRVLKGLDEAAAKRTTHQNVSDTLDALMRALRA